MTMPSTPEELRHGTLRRIAAEPSTLATLQRITTPATMQGAESTGLFHLTEPDACFRAQRLAEGKIPFDPAVDLRLEAIIRVAGRPVYDVAGNSVELLTVGAEWRGRLSALDRDGRLSHVCASTGRIDLIAVDGRPHPVGTACVIGGDILLTNRHVARIFTCHPGMGGSLSSANLPSLMSVYFGAERKPRDSRNRFSIEKIVDIAGASSPDLALLQIRWADATSRPPLILAPEGRDFDVIAVVGHPGKDERPTLKDVMAAVFGNVFDIKRVAVGRKMPSPPHPWKFAHDCTTLGGNSGSPVIDLSDGRLVGLHYAGLECSANYAVSASALGAYLKKHGVQNS